MTGVFYSYRLAASVSWSEAVDTLTLAVLGATALHGETAARLDGRYRLNVNARIIEVAGDSPFGVDLNRLFALYAAKEFGEQSFTVERLSTVRATSDSIPTEQMEGGS